MAQYFEIYKLEEVVRDADGNVELQRYFFDFPEDAEEALAELLVGTGKSVLGFQWSLDDRFSKDGWWPWALVAFPEEYRLAGHLVSIRDDRDEFGISAFSLRIGHNVAEDGVPPVSLVWFRSKDALAKASRRSRLFDCAWDVLKDRSEERHWFVVSDAPDREWLPTTSRGDDERFLERYHGGH